MDRRGRDLHKVEEGEGERYAGWISLKAEMNYRDSKMGNMVEFKKSPAATFHIN
jgi:hypothetical protein